MRYKGTITSIAIAAIALSGICATEAKTKNGSKGYCKGLVAAKEIHDKEMRHDEINKCIADPSGYK